MTISEIRVVVGWEACLVKELLEAGKITPIIDRT